MWGYGQVQLIWQCALEIVTIAVVTLSQSVCRHVFSRTVAAVDIKQYTIYTGIYVVLHTRRDVSWQSSRVKPRASASAICDPT